MVFQYDSLEKEVTNTYLDLIDLEETARDFFIKKDYSSAITQANLLLEGLGRIEKLLTRHPNRPVLEMQIGEQLREYRRSARNLKRASGSLTDTSPHRTEEQPESIESRAFWEQTYRDAYALML